MDDLDDAPVTLARADSVAGEVVLRRRPAPSRRGRDPDVFELIVNGAFAMDTVDVSTERHLAELVLTDGATNVLVGGLGLGFTALALAQGGAGRVEVVELCAPLVEWARARLTPSLAAVAADRRITLRTGDIADVLTKSCDTWDAIVLDVDNGPDFLIRPENADLYRPGLLARSVDRLRPGGLLLIWCQGASAELAAALAGLGEVVRRDLPVSRDGRDITYVVHGVRRQG